jgi:hypothetical protein
MHAIRGRFDGEKVTVPEAALKLPPGEVIVVFVERGDGPTERDAWTKSQERAFAEVWTNAEDAVYDTL